MVRARQVLPTPSPPSIPITPERDVWYEDLRRVTSSFAFRTSCIDLSIAYIFIFVTTFNAGQKGSDFYDSTIWISPSTFLAVVFTSFTEQFVEAIAREVLLSPLLIIERLARYQGKEP